MFALHGPISQCLKKIFTRWTPLSFYCCYSHKAQGLFGLSFISVKQWLSTKQYNDEYLPAILEKSGNFICFVEFISMYISCSITVVIILSNSLSRRITAVTSSDIAALVCWSQMSLRTLPLRCCQSLKLVMLHSKLCQRVDRHYHRLLIHSSHPALYLWLGTSPHWQHRSHWVDLLGTRWDLSALCRRLSHPCKATTTSCRILKLMVNIVFLSLL